MKKVLICQHGGSADHGYEAMARTTVSMLRQAHKQVSIELYSYRRGDDENYLQDLTGLRISGLKQLPGKYSPYHLPYLWQKLARHDEFASKLPLTKEFRRAVAEADVIIAICGANYCYQQWQDYQAHDRYIKQQGKPYVLLGASIEPADLPAGLARHLQLFDLIMAREKITYQALRDYGVNNAALCPDAAFLLPAETTRLPNGFARNKTVGINISPDLIRDELTNGILLDNYRTLIKHILGSTRMQVALIPYAAAPGHDDRAVLDKLKQEFANDRRVVVVADTGARELKYIISQLRFFVGARLHAVIAAYTAFIPTLSVDASTGARGIAADLFGDAENYVLTPQQLNQPDQLTLAFIWLTEHERHIKQRLQEMMPAYQGLARGAALYMQRMIEGKELLMPGAQLLPAKDRCTGCALCSQVCGSGAIRMEKDAEGFLYPRTDAELCVKCGLCGKMCAVNHTPPRPAAPEAFAAKLLDKEIRLLSSSGGIFTPLAQDLLNYGGYVCAAAFDIDLRLRHIITDNEADLSQMRGSKYLQSDLSEIYKPLWQILEAQRPLLFCGTPCQTMAIRNLCGDHEYLLTVALACHGVPSELAFRKYIGELENRRGLRAVHVDFKQKEHGWQNAQTRIHFGGGGYTDQPNRQSAYMRAFLGNLCLRPSCHDCVAKQGCYADLLIGDYWGIEKILPDFADDMGVSVVLTLSEKGRAALKGIGKQLRLRQTSFADAWHYNPAIVRSAPDNARRQDFFAQLNDTPLTTLVNKLLPPPTGLEKLKRRVKKLLRYIHRSTLKTAKSAKNAKKA